MSNSLSDLIKKYSNLKIIDILDIYSTARLNTLLELKDKIKGYPLNGVLKGAILEKDINMWISNDTKFYLEEVLVTENKQSRFELSHIPLKKSLIGYIMPSKFLTVDIQKIEGKTCFVTIDYAEMLEKGDVIQFNYIIDEE